MEKPREMSQINLFSKQVDRIYTGLKCLLNGSGARLKQENFLFNDFGYT